MAVIVLLGAPYRCVFLEDIEAKPSWYLILTVDALLSPAAR